MSIVNGHLFCIIAIGIGKVNDLGRPKELIICTQICNHNDNIELISDTTTDSKNDQNVENNRKKSQVYGNHNRYQDFGLSL